MTDKEIEALAKKLDYSSLDSYKKSIEPAKAVGAAKAKAASDTQKQAATPKTAADMQKKKEEQQPIVSVDTEKIQEDAKKKEDQAKKAMEDQAAKDRKAAAEAALADFDENEDYDATSTVDRQRYDAERKRLQAEVDKAGAALDRVVHERNQADIEAMDEETKALLEEYVRSRDNRNDLFTNDISWFISHKKEKESLAALEKAFGKERAQELAETYSRDLHRKDAAEEEARARQQVDKGWISATVANLLGSPARVVGGITGTLGRLDEKLTGTGQYNNLSEYNYGDMLSVYGNAVQDETASNIAGDVYDEEGGNKVEDGGTLRELGSLAYQGATSVLDSTTRLLLGGGSAGVSSAIAAMGGFSQGIQKYTAMGASPEKATQAAIVSAGIEYITEKIPTDEVLKVFNKGGTGAIKDVLMQTFITEPTAEELNLFAGIAAEAAILGQQSGKEQRIGDLVASGMDRKEAEKQFWKETMLEAAQTYAVSSFAGFLGSGSAALAGREVQTAQELRQASAPSPTVPGVQKDAATAEADALQEILEGTAAGLQQETAPQTPTAPAVPTAEQPSPLEKAIADVTGAADQQDQTTYYDEFEDFGTGGANREEFLGRDWDEVGKRNVKAYMYENPEVKPYFQMEAQLMLMELADSTRGERTYNEDVHYESGGEKGWSGVKRHTSEDIAYLLDTAGFSYAEIEKGLNAIIEDNGAENNAASKRIEFILHNRLMNGHKDFYSDRETYPDGRIPASDEYVQLINDKQISTNDNEPTATVDTPEAVGDNLTAFASSPQTEDSGTMPAEGGQIPTKGEKDGQRVLNGFASSDFRNSNTYMNTGIHSANENIRKGYRDELRQNPDAARYEVKHNADTLAEAQSRTGSPDQNASALDDLLTKEHWTPEDVATSTLLLDQIMASGDKDAIAQLNALRQKRKEAGTYSGQVSQSFSIQNPTMKTAESPATAVDAFRSNLNNMKPEETTWSQKKSGVDFETWKEKTCQEVDNIGIQIACVEDGDTESMRKIITQIARHRQTTAWFGTSDNLTNRAFRILKNMDFDDLKQIANTQLVAMADDYRARSTGEVVKGLRKQSMLTSLKTFTRNIAGNATGGLVDSVSESGAGRLADLLLSHFTGKKTIGNDLARAGTYMKAAKEAGEFAALCVELNIPIETDVEASYQAAAGKGGNNKYLGKTFRATGNPAMRAMYAYQKYMSYALEVTDKVFEGGTNAAVTESLNRLKGANLTDQDVEALADYTGNRRTFKNATWKEGGDTKGSALSRGAAKLQKDAGIVGEVAAPFVSTPMNVTQAGIDYTGGVAESLYQIGSIIKDAKAGKDIPVERQRQAASTFGRGVTGTAMIGMFAAAAATGALRSSEDDNWNKEALAQAEGRSGVQINWSALQRGMEDGSTQWQDGDVITGLDFLEPFNTQMYLGVELANADDFSLLTYGGATLKSVLNSLMDSPVMTGLADIEETLKDVTEAETGADKLNAVAGYAGNAAASFVPQVVRQAAQDQDGYYRDTRGANAWESAVNSAKASIPGLSETLPKKYSGLGEVQERGTAAETFLDPTATKTYDENEVTTFLDDLSERMGKSADGIYPERQAPMKFTYADGREVQLDGQMREDYQKTYGEKVNELYSSLMANEDFQGLSGELQVKALEEAKTYARKTAMAAVSDYKDAPVGDAATLASEIVSGETGGEMSGLFSVLDIQRDYGYSIEETAAKLDASYDAYTKMDPESQRKILEDASGDTAKYLEVRKKGVTTDEFLKATEGINGLEPRTGNEEVKAVQRWQVIDGLEGLSDSSRDSLMRAWMSDSQAEEYFMARRKGVSTKEYVTAANNIDLLKPYPGEKNVKDIQKWDAIGNMSASEKAKDALMKVYMQDYDPTDKSPVKTELKYDYARQELDLTPQQFVTAYEINQTGKRDSKFERMEAAGFDDETAEALYRLLSATGKTKIDTVEWYNSQ